MNIIIKLPYFFLTGEKDDLNLRFIRRLFFN